MGQAEYEAFKAKLREWMETHPEEYAAFEESMNTRDMAGCQAVLLQAIALIPQYRKLAAAKANEGLFDHVDGVENMDIVKCENKLLNPYYRCILLRYK